MDLDAAHDPTQEALRNLPAVDHLLRQPAIANLLSEQPRGELIAAIRAVLDERRDAIRANRPLPTDVGSLALAVRHRLYERSLPHLRRVVNATGIVLHTGLGRAPLAAEAVEAVADVAAGYCNLELDLASGRRGDRHEHARELLRELTGAEDALVVNNNAGATFLALNTLAAEREVVVSRGQLVEIGGSYRMPDIMAAARCRMVEVGTTNRTRIADYERALSLQTAALLRVHTSNYRVLGFVASAELEELVELARRHNLLVIDDLGSGLLDESLPLAGRSSESPPDGSVGDDGEGAPNGTPAPAPSAVSAAPGAPDSPAPPAWDEPSVRHSVSAGADLTLFSGDKLLGGPQAGVIVGRAELIARLRQNPLTRALRPDKMTLAGLEATLRLYRDPDSLRRRLPTLRMLTVGLDELERAARALASSISQYVPNATIACESDESLAGGGSLPLTPFKTWVVSVRLANVSAADLSAALRDRSMPIICRIRDEALIFDCRTLGEDDGEQIASALGEIVHDMAS